MIYLLRWPGTWIMPYGNPLQPHVPLILDAQFPKNCFVVGEIGHLYSKKHFLMLWQGEEQGTSVLGTDKNSPGETEEADVSFSLLPVGASISPLNTMQLDWNVRERSNCEEGEKEMVHKYSVFHQQLHKEIGYKSEKIIHWQCGCLQVSQNCVARLSHVVGHKLLLLPARIRYVPIYLLLLIPDKT